MNAMFWCIQSLLAGAALVLMAACIDVPETSSGGTQEPDIKATMEATIQAGRPPTATAIPPTIGKCPPEVDPAVCASGIEFGSVVARGAIDQLPLAPISIICPDTEAGPTGTEPQCSKGEAGLAQSGFASGTKVYSFVDEAAFRADLKARLSSAHTVAGIGCPRASDDAALDCSGPFVVVFADPSSPAAPVFLLARRSAGEATIFGARGGLAQEAVAVRGGWASVGLSKVLPARIYVIPWRP